MARQPYQQGHAIDGRGGVMVPFTCKTCGATVMVFPADDHGPGTVHPAIKAHDDWHEQQLGITQGDE